VQSLVVVDDEGTITDVIARGGLLMGDAAREFRIVTLNFLASGGDGYPFESLASDRVDTEMGEQQALADLLVARHGIGAGNPFAVAETPAASDTTIQNLAVREDSIFADAAADGRIIIGTNKADFLFGGAGDDTILGLAANDYLDGGAGNDQLAGGPGDDTLIGGPGNDTLIGGPGKNTFVAAPGMETDTVLGAGRQDLFDVRAFGITSFEDILERATSTGRKTQITFDAESGDSFVLKGISIGSLSARNFIFADDRTAVNDEPIPDLHTTDPLIA
jgi:Ca2+-binding RTX toxin-like protein